MRIAKSCFVVVCAMALLVALCSLSGCGEAKAAKWAHGKVLEEDVTTQITNIQSNEGLSSDKSGWEKYIKKYKYNDDADKKEVKAKSGTVAAFREYEIKEIIKQQILEYEVKEANIEVPEDEVQSSYDEQAKSYEKTYAGGLSGTFESIIEMMGYESADAFKDTVRENLKQEAYKKQVCGDDYTDEDWEKYINQKYDEAEVEITECPSDLSYDPANMSDDSSDSTDSADTTDTGSTDTDADANTDASTQTDANTDSTDSGESTAANTGADSGTDTNSGSNSDSSAKK